jgi:hypothetical protein
MQGECSYPNVEGFYKKQNEDGKRDVAGGGDKFSRHLRISQTYLGDITPMFGTKTAYENVYGPIIPALSSIVPKESILVYPAYKKSSTIYPMYNSLYNNK